MFRKLFSLIITIIVMPVWAHDGIEVIAIEYPPFTTTAISSSGIAFQLLNDLTASEGIEWNPLFLPPKRAYRTISSGNWCASFYPATDVDEYIQYALGVEPIKVGLVRENESWPFVWSSLDQLKGKTVALLRSDLNSLFVHQFKDANLNIIFVETVDIAMNMVLLGRVDIAISDNISYSNLPQKHRSQLQFSQSYLNKTKISIFVNKRCDIPLLDLDIIKQVN